MAARFREPTPVWCRSGAVGANGGRAAAVAPVVCGWVRLINAPSELLAARIREVAVFPAAQVAVAVGEVEPFPDPLAHAGVEVNGEKLVGDRHLVLDGDQLGRLVVDQI